jgi:hypothetical protein
VQFSGDDIKIVMEMKYMGRFASVLRGYTLYNPNFVQESIAKVFNDRIGACSVDQSTVNDGWKNADPFHITAHVTAHNWLKHAGNLHLLKLPWLGGYLSPMTVAEQTRRTDYIIPGPEHVECLVHIHLPAPLETHPENKKFQACGNDMTISFQTEAGCLKMSIVLDSEVHKVSREDYPAYRSFVYSVNKFFENLLVLKPLQ